MKHTPINQEQTFNLNIDITILTVEDTVYVDADRVNQLFGENLTDGLEHTFTTGQGTASYIALKDLYILNESLLMTLIAMSIEESLKESAD